MYYLHTVVHKIKYIDMQNVHLTLPSILLKIPFFILKTLFQSQFLFDLDTMFITKSRIKRLTCIMCRLNGIISSFI